MNERLKYIKREPRGRARCGLRPGRRPAGVRARFPEALVPASTCSGAMLARAGQREEVEQTSWRRWLPAPLGRALATRRALHRPTSRCRSRPAHST
jgi:malonyl-CoA O-methyltransferase